MTVLGSKDEQFTNKKKSKKKINGLDQKNTQNRPQKTVQNQTPIEQPDERRRGKSNPYLDNDLYFTGPY